MSRPPWARELKLGAVGNLVEAGQSRPPWARELKLSNLTGAVCLMVAPPVGA